MSFAAIAVTAIVAFCTGLHVEHRAQGADVEALEAKVKAEIKVQLSGRVALVEAWAAREQADVKSVIEQVRGHITQIFA